MENIILDEKKKNLKLIDFGLSNTFSTDQLLKTHCGSPEYAAPELFVSGREYGPEVDIWSFGVIVYAMVTGKLPFTAPHVENRRQKLLLQINAGLVSSHHERDMKYLTPDCAILLRRCVEPNSMTRIHLLDIESHPWITLNGTDPFFSFQQPPKDPGLKAIVLQKMSEILNITRSKLEDAIHEFRADEYSAIYNMLVHEQLRSMGLWEGDHTRRKRVRPNTSRSQSATPDGRKSERPDSTCHCEHQPIRVKTPTIVGMVRPSQKTTDIRNIFSADFELAVVSAENCNFKRPRTSTFPQTSFNNRPLGNATTVNIILARNQQTNRKSSATLQTRPKNPGDLLKPHSCPATPNHQLVAPYPSAVEVQSRLIKAREGDVAKEDEEKTPKKEETDGQALAGSQSKEGDQKNSKGNNETATSSYCGSSSTKGSTVTPAPQNGGTSFHPKTKQPIRKANLSYDAHIAGQLKSESSQKRLERGTRKLGVVDIGNYFPKRHGYHTQETPLLLHSAPKQNNSTPQKGGILKNPSESVKHTRKTSFKLCEGHRDQLHGMLSRQCYEFKTSRQGGRGTPHNSKDEKTNDHKSPTPLKITLEHGDSRGTTPEKWHQFRKGGNSRHQSFSRKYKVDTKNSHKARKTSAAQRISNIIIEQSSKFEITGEERHSLNSQNDSHINVNEDYVQSTRACSPRPVLRTPVASLQSGEEICRILSTDSSRCQSPDFKNGQLGMPQRLEWKRTHSADVKPTRTPIPKKDCAVATMYQRSSAVKQKVPDETIRVTSAKLRTQNKVTQGDGSKSRKDHQVNLAASQRQKMLKYGGYVIEDGHYSKDSYDNISLFSTQGLFGILLNNPNIVCDGDTSNRYLGKVLSGSKKPTKSEVARHIENQQKIPHWQTNCPESIETLKLNSTPVAQLKTNAKPAVFDLEISQNVINVEDSNKMFKLKARVNGNKTDWEKTYKLERKISDTLKGGSDIAKLRKTPEPVGASN